MNALAISSPLPLLQLGDLDLLLLEGDLAAVLSGRSLFRRHCGGDGDRLRGDGDRFAGEGVLLLGDGVRLLGDGVRLRGDGVRLLAGDLFLFSGSGSIGYCGSATGWGLKNWKAGLLDMGWFLGILVILSSSEEVESWR